MTTNRLDSLRQISVPTSELEKEGWLIKKGKKRYFVLSNAHLMWFDRPKGEAKGSLSVKEYTVQLKDGGTLKKELILIPQDDKKGLKAYHLEADRDQDTVEWAKTLKKVLNFEREDDAEPTKLGWLEKKGQKRWFLIREGKLYWFNKEQFITPDVAKSANGSLDLAECTVVSGPDQKQKGNSTNFNFTVKNSKDTYILTAKTEQEKDEWVDVIKDAIRWTKKSSRDKRKSTLQDSKALPEKRGWLVKKGQKRYFVLKDCVLKWYIDSNEKNQERGSLPLLDCSVELNPEKLEVAIKDSKGTHYELYAQSFQEADDWYFMLDLSAERAKKVLQGQNVVPRDSIRVDDSQSRASMEPRQGRVSLGARDKSQTTVFDPSSPRSKPPQEQQEATPQQDNTNQPEPSKQQDPQPAQPATQSEPVQPDQPKAHEEAHPQTEEPPAAVATTEQPQQVQDKVEQPTVDEAANEDSEDEIIYDDNTAQQQGHQRTPSTDSSDQSDHEPPKASQQEDTTQLEQKIHQVELEKEHLEKELKKANSSRDVLLQNTKSLEHQLEQNQVEMNRLRQEIQRINEDKQHQATPLDAIKALEDRIQEEAQETSKLEVQLQQLRDELLTEKQQKDEIQSQLKLEQQQTQALQVALSQEREQHKQEIQSLIGIQSDQSSVESKLQQALAKEADLENHLRDQKQTNDKLERHNTELQNRLEQEKADSAHKVDQLKQEKKELKLKYETLQADTDNRLQVLQTNLSKVTQEKESLSSQLAAEKVQVSALQEQKERLEQDIKSERERISLVQDQLKDHNEHGALAKSRITILEAEVAEKEKLEKEFHALKQQHDHDLQEKQRIEALLTEEKDKVDSAQKLLESEREAHKKEIQSILSSSTDQTNNVGKVLSEKAEIERQLHEEQQKVQQLKKSKEALETKAKQDHDDNKKQLDEQQQQIETLNKNIKSLTEKLATTQSHLDAMDNNLKMEADAKQQLEKQAKLSQQRVVELEAMLKGEQQKQRELEKELHEVHSVKKEKHQIEEELKAERSRSQTLQSQLSDKSSQDKSVLQIKEENENLKKQLLMKEKSLKTRWRPDHEADKCIKCHGEFGLFNRRHHCRHCGEIFCANCSSKQAPMSPANPQLVRVCDTCFADTRPASQQQRLSAPV